MKISDVQGWVEKNIFLAGVASVAGVIAMFGLVMSLATRPCPKCPEPKPIAVVEKQIVEAPTAPAAKCVTKLKVGESVVYVQDGTKAQVSEIEEEVDNNGQCIVSVVYIASGERVHDTVWEFELR